MADSSDPREHGAGDTAPSTRPTRRTGAGGPPNAEATPRGGNALVRRVRLRIGRLLAGPTQPQDEGAGGSLLDLGPVRRGWRVVDERHVAPGVAAVRVLEDPVTGEKLYEIHEPRLGREEVDILAFVKDAFVRTLDVDLETLDDTGAHGYVREAVARILWEYGIRMPPESHARLRYYLERDFLGFGPIDPIMRDPEVEDVSCDGPGTPLYVFDRRHESVPTTLVFPDHGLMDGFVMQLVQRSGKDISVAEPLVDATLPDGSRLQATFSKEITTRGSTFTIRKVRDEPFTLVDLMRFGTASAEMLAYLWLVAENGRSTLFCGGTASGKTTSLNAFSTFIPLRDKIVSIEDTRELVLPHPNWIPGVTRGVSLEAEGEAKPRGSVTMFDLLKAALRQRPEYILFGEIRGREAYVLFQAMATGHTVYSTMHADSAPSAVYRLESQPIGLPRIMLNALDLLVLQSQVRIRGERARRIKEMVEVAGIDPVTGDLLTNKVFEWDGIEDRHRYLGKSEILDRIRDEHGMTTDEMEVEFQNRVRVIEWMDARGLRSVPEISRVLATYAQDPDALLERVVARRVQA